jgi:hypothetical protein
MVTKKVLVIESMTVETTAPISLIKKLEKLLYNHCGNDVDWHFKFKVEE